MWYNTEFTVPPITYPHSRPKLSSEQNQAVRLMLQFTGILKDRGTKETILRRNAQTNRGFRTFWFLKKPMLPCKTK